MPKKIELVSATDPHSLKEKLEEMINQGWEIRGFVSFNPVNTSMVSYAVLERATDKIPEREIYPEADEVLSEKQVSNKSGKKVVTISMGDGV